MHQDPAGGDDESGQAIVSRPPDFGVKLFLDVDGVIAPYANRDAEHRESLFVSVPSRFDGRPPRTYTLTYSPSVIAELELLIVDFRLDLVFLSTWNATMRSNFSSRNSAPSNTFELYQSPFPE